MYNKIRLLDILSERGKGCPLPTQDIDLEFKKS